MKRILIFGYLLLFRICHAEVTIDVVYPQQDSVVTAQDSAFIFGSVSPAHAKLTINGRHVPLYDNGAFISMFPIESGDFSFVCMATADNDTTILIRDVIVPQPIQTSPSEFLSFDYDYIFPHTNWQIYEADVLHLAFKGTPHCRAEFSIDGLISNVPMREMPPEANVLWGEKELGQRTPSTDPPVEGIYVGTLYVQPWHRCQQAAVHFRLIHANGDTLVAEAPGTISIYNSTIPQLCEFTRNFTMAVPGQKRGAQYFFPANTQAKVLKQAGTQLLIQLAHDKTIWIRDNAVELLPPGVMQEAGILTDIQTEELERYSRIFITLGRKVPYRIEQWKKPSALLVRLYDVFTDTIRRQLSFDGSIIRNIHPHVVSIDQVELKIPLKIKQQWGYRAYFENGNFVLDVKHPPKHDGWRASPLKGLSICLDPGHGPDNGATGPTRLTEREANLWICERLKETLEDKGAYVLLTREGAESTALYTRPQLASLFQADILLSVHFNSLRDGINPFHNRGIGNYFYHPMSERLAYNLQERLWRKTRLKDFGVFREALVLTRPTDMISVLTEPAFIIHPEEEMLIRSPKFQKKIVDAIVEGLELFVKKANR